MKTILLRPAGPEDLEFVLELNNEAVPHVSRLDMVALERFSAQAPYFKVASDGDKLCGFLIALTPNVVYESPNFNWFKARYLRFFYIDRIVVSPDSRGAGLGQHFYQDLEATAADVAPRLTCEVNLKPANDNSLRFHKRYGFREVGRQDTEGGAKTVCLMVKEIVSRET